MGQGSSKAEQQQPPPPTPPPPPPPPKPRVDLPPHLLPAAPLNDQASFVGALKNKLKMPDSPKGQRVLAVGHMIGDCNAGKSQLLNTIASCLKGDHLESEIRQVGTFNGTHQQCSIRPFRYRASGSDKDWKVENDGEMYINDNRGNAYPHDLFHLQILKLLISGRLKPTEVYPLDPSANRARAIIDEREPESENPHATVIAYCVTAKKLMDDKYVCEKIRAVIEQVKSIENNNGTRDAELELPFLLVVTCVDQLGNDIKPIDLVCSIRNSPNEKLALLYRSIKTNLGLNEDRVVLTGFLENLSDRVFDFSDKKGKEQMPDFAVMAVRNLLLRFAKESSSWIARHGIVQKETARWISENAYMLNNNNNNNNENDDGGAGAAGA